MKKIVRLIYTGMLGVSFLITSPIIVNRVLEETPDTKATAMSIPQNISAETKVTATDVPQNAPVETMDTVTDVPQNAPAETMDTEAEEIQMEESQPEETQEIIEYVQDTPEAGLTFIKSDPSYFDDALFIGDSRMEDIRDYGTLDNADYFCSIGLSTYGLLSDDDINGITFTQKISNALYGKVYIMLGLNQAEDGAEVFRRNMGQVLDMVQEQQPDAIIYLMANLHVSAQASIDNPKESNENINALNAALQEFINNEKIFYLDINSVFDDEYGCLPAEASGDGVHPYATYYPEWCEWICEHTITPESKQVSLPSFDFGEAIENVKNGKRISRKSWGNDAVWIELQQINNAFSIQIHSETNEFSSWTASQEDMFAEDWYVIEAIS